MIVSHDHVVKAVERARRLGSSDDEAIETVAAALHLPADQVREILQQQESQSC